MSRPAVFLDRDGTLLDDTGYPSRFDQVRILPSSIAAVRKLNEAGFSTVIVTNQSGVGRGFLTEDELLVLHRSLAAAFEAQGARLDAFYFCPHFSRAADPRYRIACDCRKPLPSLGRRAAADLGLDLRRSFMIGDKEDDMNFGRAVGVVPVLVLTGYGREARRKMAEKGTLPDIVAADVGEAVDRILARGSAAGS
ncbi:MAG: HAD family hydrolase [Candidatus Aminicenantes bacterium]|nr:HAD family hydrolase [Candidatus Aminicenantes bacterium]